MEFNVILRPNGLDLSNVIIRKSSATNLYNFLAEVFYDKGIYTDDGSAYIPIDSIAFYRVIEEDIEF